MNKMIEGIQQYRDEENKTRQPAWLKGMEEQKKLMNIIQSRSPNNHKSKENWKKKNDPENYYLM